MTEIKSPKPKLALSTLIFGHFLNHFYAYVLGVALVVIRQPNRLDNLNSIVIHSAKNFASNVLNSNLIFNRLPDLTDTQTGVLTTIQMLIFAIVTLGIGVLSDKWLKAKTLFVPLGIFIMAIHLFIAAYARTFGTLVVAIVIVAIGATFYHPVAYSSIADLYEKKKGLTMALNAGLGIAGTSIIPVIVTVFHTKFGWRNLFIVLGIICIVLSIIMYFAMEYLIKYTFTEEEIKQQNERRETMDKKARFKNWLKTEFLVLITFAIIVCLFYSSFRSGIFRITNNFLATIFNDFYGFPIEAAGWITSTILVIGGLTAIVGGIVSDKYTTSLTMLISLGGASIIFSILTFGPKNLPNWLLISLYFVFVAFLYFSAAAGTKYVAESVPQGSRSTAISFLFTVPNTIAAIFPWLFTMIKDKVEVDTIVGNEFWMLAFILLLAVLGTVASFILFRRDFKLGKIGRKKPKDIPIIADDTL